MTLNLCALFGQGNTYIDGIILQLVLLFLTYIFHCEHLVIEIQSGLQDTQHAHFILYHLKDVCQWEML